MGKTSKTILLWNWSWRGGEKNLLTTRSSVLFLERMIYSAVPRLGPGSGQGSRRMMMSRVFDLQAQPTSMILTPPKFWLTLHECRLK